MQKCKQMTPDEDAGDCFRQLPTHALAEIIKSPCLQRCTKKWLIEMSTVCKAMRTAWATTISRHHCNADAMLDANGQDRHRVQSLCPAGAIGLVELGLHARNIAAVQHLDNLLSQATIQNHPSYRADCLQHVTNLELQIEVEWKVPSAREEQIMLVCVQKALQMLPAIKSLRLLNRHAAMALCHMQHAAPATVTSLRISTYGCICLVPHLQRVLPQLQELQLMVDPRCNIEDDPKELEYLEDQDIEEFMQWQHLRHLKDLQTLNIIANNSGVARRLDWYLNALTPCTALRCLKLTADYAEVGDSSSDDAARLGVTFRVPSKYLLHPYGSIVVLAQLRELELRHWHIHDTTWLYQLPHLTRLMVVDCICPFRRKPFEEPPSNCWPQLLEVEFRSELCGVLVHHLALAAAAKLRKVLIYSTTTQIDYINASTTAEMQMCARSWAKVLDHTDVYNMPAGVLLRTHTLTSSMGA